MRSYWLVGFSASSAYSGSVSDWSEVFCPSYTKRACSVRKRKMIGQYLV